jgi:hypothetical protein
VRPETNAHEENNMTRIRFRGAVALSVAMTLATAPALAQQKTRTEHDLLGDKQIPADAYYGVQTARALENFQISGVAINHYPGFVEAWAIVKLAAARANTDVGAMKPERLAMIEKACKAVMEGKYHDQFQVDWYQGGAGTSTNMNANEVLANVGLELSGHKKGEYQFLEPHDDLNMSQSTNDSYPTAIKVALMLRNDKLIAELQNLVASFRAKGDAYLRIVKMGRTELQDAVPMTVGQEFHAFAASLEAEIQALKDAEKYLYAENMGATAIGTGINVPKGYAEKCAKHLAELTKKPIVPAADMIAATWEQQGFVLYSSALKSTAIKISKIAGDLILSRRDRGPGSPRSISPAPAGVVDHARKGQPGRARGRERRRLPCDGERLRGHARGAFRPAPVERLRADRGDSLRSSRSTSFTTSRSCSARSASTGSRSTRRSSSGTCRRRWASSPRSTRSSATRRRPSWRTRRTRAARGSRDHPREEDPHRGADQGSSRSDQADQPGPDHLPEEKVGRTP